MYELKWNGMKYNGMNKIGQNISFSIFYYHGFLFAIRILYKTVTLATFCKYCLILYIFIQYFPSK
jgi:hypothetical protein